MVFWQVLERVLTSDCTTVMRKYYERKCEVLSRDVTALIIAGGRTDKHVHLFLLRDLCVYVCEGGGSLSLGFSLTCHVSVTGYLI